MTSVFMPAPVSVNFRETYRPAGRSTPLEDRSRAARRLDGQGAAVGHGVAGVGHHVQDDLLQLAGIHLDRQGHPGAVQDHLDVFADQAPDHAGQLGPPPRPGR